MEKDMFSRTLVGLLLRDFCAVVAYDEALRHLAVRELDLRDHFAVFYDEHKRHVSDGVTLLSRFGGPEPALKEENCGPSTGRAPVLAAAGVTELLQVLRRHELVLYQSYSDALGDADFAGFPEEVRVFLRNGFGDENRHLEYIDSVLAASSVPR